MKPTQIAYETLYCDGSGVQNAIALTTTRDGMRNLRFTENDTYVEFDFNDIATIIKVLKQIEELVIDESESAP